MQTHNMEIISGYHQDVTSKYITQCNMFSRYREPQATRSPQDMPVVMGITLKETTSLLKVGQ